jgi:hypothetical protein
MLLNEFIVKVGIVLGKLSSQCREAPNIRREYIARAWFRHIRIRVELQEVCSRPAKSDFRVQFPLNPDINK